MIKNCIPVLEPVLIPVSSLQMYFASARVTVKFQMVFFLLAVEAQANTALLNVQTLDASSQQVINEANTIINSLVTTQQSASLAKEVARQAKAVAQQLKEVCKKEKKKKESMDIGSFDIQ